MPREVLFADSAVFNLMNLINLIGINVNVCEKVERQRDIEGDSIVELQ